MQVEHTVSQSHKVSMSELQTPHGPGAEGKQADNDGVDSGNKPGKETWKSPYATPEECRWEEFQA